MTQQIEMAPALAIGGIQISLAIALLILWFNAREYRVFLWLAGYLALSAFNNAHRFLTGADATLLLPLLAVMLFRVASGALQIPTGWWLRLYGAGAVLLTLLQIPNGLAGNGEAFNRPFLLVNAAAIIYVSLRALRSGPSDLRMAGAALLVYVVTFAWLPLRVQAGAWIINPVSIVSSGLGFALLGLQLQRLAADRREKQRLASELEAARLVQQFLLSDAEVRTANLIGEATYQPAQEVGGDFYQLLPCADGSLLLLVGDVSGKGLRAAMLVSLLTGAIRNRRTDGPAALLAELNRVLLAGNAGGFVTCLCAHINPDGHTRLANAGHPAPYRDGEELDLVPGLPLGIAADEYQEATMQLQSGAICTFVSDGVVEASNSSGELFGFDRTASISTKPAVEIALAAKSWGQNDDITVVTVRRR